MRKGDKVLLKDKLGFGRQKDRNKYNNMVVTVEEVRYLHDKVDVFFIEEDDSFFEWVLDQTIIKGEIETEIDDDEVFVNLMLPLDIKIFLGDEDEWEGELPTHITKEQLMKGINSMERTELGEMVLNQLHKVL